MGVVPIRLIVQRYEEEAKATNFDCVFFILQTIVSELSTRSEPLSLPMMRLKRATERVDETSQERGLGQGKNSLTFIYLL